MSRRRRRCLEHDQIGCRHSLEKFDSGVDATHVNLQMGLRHAPVFAGAFDLTRNSIGLAKCLDRYPGYRPKGMHVRITAV